jgi:hypothetical protein
MGPIGGGHLHDVLACFLQDGAELHEAIEVQSSQGLYSTSEHTSTASKPALVTSTSKRRRSSTYCNIRIAKYKDCSRPDRETQ